MSQVLGIDIGSYSIKLAFLEISKSDVILKKVMEVPIPLRAHQDEEKSAKIQAIKHVLENVNLSNLKDNIYAGLGSQYTVLQNFEFLKVASRNLPKLVENEFDELGLFSPNEYLVELNILEKISNVTKVLGVLVKTSALHDLIEVLNAHNLLVRIIDVECLAFQNLIPYSVQLSFDAAEAETNLIINIGHRKTSIIVIEDEQIIHEYSINLAGHYITSKLQKELQISYQEAEILKHKISGKISLFAENNEKAQSVLKSCCQEIGEELERIILALTRSNQPKKISRILLTGGSAKIAEFSKILENIFSIPTVNLNLVGKNFKNGTEKEFVFETFAQAIALGLRATGAKSNSTINVRHGDFALVSDYESIIQNTFAYAKIVVLVCICLLGTYFLRSYLYTKKMNEIKNLYNREIISYFGTEPPELKLISLKANWDFNQYHAKATELIETTYHQRLLMIEDIYSEKSILPLVLLNEISAIVPKSLYFEVIDYKYQDGMLNILAETNSAESVDKITELISSIKYIENVQKKLDNSKINTNLVRFSLIAEIQTMNVGE